MPSKWFASPRTVFCPSPYGLGEQSAADNLVRRIKDFTPDKKKLSTPGVELIKLPFPTLSIRKPTDRFALDTDRNLEYIPRRKFSELLFQVEALIEQPDRASAIWFYGTIGYGKSYILAALVCFLMKSGHRVLFLPDCRTWLDEPEAYLQDAMRLTWADDSVTLREIDGMKTVPEMAFFLQTAYGRQGIRR